MRRKKRKIDIATADDTEAGQQNAGAAGIEDADPAGQPSDEVPEGDTTAADVEPEDELEAARRKIDELTDKHLRAVAEHKNYVRRSQTSHGESLRYAPTGLARSLLEVVDDFERTMATVADDDESPLAKGVRLVHQKLVKTLETHHVSRIESVGRPFDPSFHEAIMQQPTDQHEPGTVMEEYQPGYSLWDRVLRPAKVIVATAPLEEAAAETGQAADAGTQKE